MFCKLISYCLNGLDPIPIEIEIDLSDGLPYFEIVGLPDSAVKESKERVKSAIKNSGFAFPIQRITVNLAPGNIRKEGSLYDLPIALGILCCSGVLSSDAINNIICIGELALSGELRPISEIFPILCTIQSQRLCSIIPIGNTKQASLLSYNQFFLASSLHEVVAHLQQKVLLPTCTSAHTPSLANSCLDFKDVKGQDAAKRGLMISAAGFHNVLLIGPPGSGKSMLAKRLPALLPPLSSEEQIELTKIYSISHNTSDYGLITNRPFRTPHHTASSIALTGGGKHPKPGEISLSHLGILFLDELLEFSRSSLEILRQPLEDHTITITRVDSTVTYPAHFLLVASTNPCPCGYYPDKNRCSCSFPDIRKYLQKLSGPLMERIDIHLETKSVSLEALTSTQTLSTKEMRIHVQGAIKIQQERYSNYTFTYNSEIPDALLTSFCILTTGAKNLLKDWFHYSVASIRVYNRILKLSRTIADLSGHTTIEVNDIAEALQYRLLDRDFWK